MKLAKLGSLLAVAVVLSFTAVGCRKGMDKTTHIPIGNMGVPQTEPPRSLRAGGNDGGSVNPILGDGRVGLPPVNPSANTGLNNNLPPVNTEIVSPPVPGPEGFPASGKDFNMDENREEFKNQTVYFDFDKANIKAKEVSKLEEVARRMKSNFADKFLRIEGHCDERGTEEYNRSLGDRRAQSVREQLVKLGLDPERIQTITFGEEKPADSGHNNAAWEKNRRGEILLLTPRGAASAK